jgi:ABC-type multidrug transport system fused ATPase/permease subunit
MTDTKQKPWWRWPVYVFASISLLVSLMWLAEGLMAPMGYGGRSQLQIVLFILFIILLPFVATVFFALRAAEEARKSELRRSLLSTTAALLLLPAVWLLDVFVLRL